MSSRMIAIAEPKFSSKEISAIVKVCKSGIIAQGPVVKEFEKKFAQFCGTKYAIAVSNGTAALHCALYACNIQPGDEVITTPFTFVATANTILMQGAKPVFVDIDPLTFNIDPTKIEKKINQKTKAILPVDLYGQLYDSLTINKLSLKYNLKIIEDACQAVGAIQNGKKAGNLGNIGCFSFYATKNLTTGEGGMITTNNKRLYEAAKMFRHHGQNEKKRYYYADIGYNYRMTDIIAAIGLVQLEKIEKINEKRRRNAEKLTEGLKNIPGIIIPNTNTNSKHVFHQYTIRVTDKFKVSRDKLIAILTKKGIGTAVFYPKPLHLHPHITKLGYKKGDFPITEKITNEVLSLPVHPLVSQKNINLIIKTIQNI